VDGKADIPKKHKKADDALFEIQFTKEVGSLVKGRWLVRCKDHAERDDWMHAINQAIAQKASLDYECSQKAWRERKKMAVSPARLDYSLHRSGIRHARERAAQTKAMIDMHSPALDTHETQMAHLKTMGFELKNPWPPGEWGIIKHSLQTFFDRTGHWRLPPEHVEHHDEIGISCKVNHYLRYIHHPKSTPKPTPASGPVAPALTPTDKPSPTPAPDPTLTPTPTPTTEPVPTPESTPWGEVRPPEAMCAGEDASPTEELDEEICEL